jgi:DNA-binding transcriptional MerR regulator
MKISELAVHTGVAVSAIRHYEAEALLSPPTRSGNNYRQYGSAHVEELTFLRNCRALNMTFDEIRALKSLKERRDVDCSAASNLLNEHIGHIDAEIEKLSAIRRELETLRALCVAPSSSADCEIMHAIKTRGAEVTAPIQASPHPRRHGL